MATTKKAYEKELNNMTPNQWKARCKKLGLDCGKNPIDSYTAIMGDKPWLKAAKKKPVSKKKPASPSPPRKTSKKKKPASPSPPRKTSKKKKPASPSPPRKTSKGKKPASSPPKGGKLCKNKKVCSGKTPVCDTSSPRGRCLGLTSKGIPYDSAKMMIKYDDYFFDKKNMIVGGRDNVNELLREWGVETSIKKRKKKDISPPSPPKKKKKKKDISPPSPPKKKKKKKDISPPSPPKKKKKDPWGKKRGCTDPTDKKSRCLPDKYCSANTGKCISQRKKYAPNEKFEHKGRTFVGTADNIAILKGVLGIKVSSKKQHSKERLKKLLESRLDDWKEACEDGTQEEADELYDKILDLRKKLGKTGKFENCTVDDEPDSDDEPEPDSDDEPEPDSDDEPEPEPDSDDEPEPDSDEDVEPEPDSDEDVEPVWGSPDSDDDDDDDDDSPPTPSPPRKKKKKQKVMGDDDIRAAFTKCLAMIG
uniref:Proline-rich protein n=1 Tax=Marseillevirus LCMAC101 TaxID=2506602 RepID=A0A481YQK5_9VIRU|nr:MAG: proline-rich protein [Marseillevirus LCMAC101]